MTKTLLERIEAKVMVDPNSGCWIWTDKLRPDGYGQIHVGGKIGPVKLAHRIIYEMMVGAVPTGLELDHKCRKRWCVNPKHLEPVTHAENIARGDLITKHKAKVAARTHCPRGHKFTAENSYIYRTKAGYLNRQCRDCWKERSYQC